MADFSPQFHRFKKAAAALGFWGLTSTLAQAQVSLVSMTISNSNPAPGSVVAVTVTYCDTANRTPYWLVAVNPSSTSIQTCPSANQFLLVDGGTTPTGVSPVSSSQDDASDPGGNGWAGIAVPNTPPPCNYTQVFNVTIPSNLNSGTYNLIVKVNDYFVQCTSAGVQLSTSITVPYPPANISLSEVADGSTANPGDLVLFHIDYSYVNTGPVTVTATLPANVALAGSSGNISPGGTLSGSTITWVLPATLPTQTGEVWFLTKVNGGVPAGTVITNSATAASTSAGTVTSNSAQVNVGAGGFQLVKSESASLTNLGSTVTYTLSYQVSGESLQSSDNYDNNPTGTGNGSITGFDGTGYTYNNTGGQGGITVQADASGNHYLQACASNTCNSSVTVANFPTLLRNTPAINLCGNFMVEGDMQIPVGSAPGADASMVIAQNLAAGGVYDAYVIGISLDCGPGNFFMQRNQSPNSVTFPKTLCNSMIGTTITAGVWYTVKVLVTYSAGALQFQAKVWPQGTAEPGAFSLNWTDATPLPCTAINGGNYMMGWQADGTSSTDYFTNLKLYGPSPVVNPRLWDTLPAGLNFAAATPTAPSFQSGSYLEWDLGGAHPVTTYNITGGITVLAAVTACGPPAVNQAAIMGDGGASMVSSNAVTLLVNGCFTNTPTFTPTATPTPTNTGTLPPTNTPTNTPTMTSTPTATPPNVDIFYVDHNLFNPATQPVSITVQYSKYPGDYSLRIYNTAGEHIRTLDSFKAIGPINQSYTWDGKNKSGDACASGVYILYLIEPFDRKLKRLILIR